ncbi:hypothetical protein RRG08_014842 [Elysia crispata]|uniref:Uncharacterized protein n=1 Tax=Elysia crispata TaxID=231223 RepID=A0AAE0Z548_9GAST|nr:hypothetical protein RRG08_014842 [Elysia crispata]
METERGRRMSPPEQTKRASNDVCKTWRPFYAVRSVWCRLTLSRSYRSCGGNQCPKGDHCNQQGQGRKRRSLLASGVVSSHQGPAHALAVATRRLSAVYGSKREVLGGIGLSTTNNHPGAPVVGPILRRICAVAGRVQSQSWRRLENQQQLGMHSP